MVFFFSFKFSQQFSEGDKVGSLFSTVEKLRPLLQLWAH